MQCPKDGVPCSTKTLEDVTIDVCSQCGGVWLEQNEVRRLVRHFSLPQYSNVDELLARWEDEEHKGTLPHDFWAEDKLVCPIDGEQMHKHYFAGSAVGVDQCHACKGFWLDGGELMAVAQYFAPNPSLDRAWQLVLQDQKEWDRKVAKLSAFPATVVTWMASPALGVAVIGSFLLRMLIERLTKVQLDINKMAK